MILQFEMDVVFVFRIIIMICLAIFLGFLLILYRKAKEENLKSKARYCLAFSIFFLALLANYLQFEMNLLFGSTTDRDADIYPNIIPVALRETPALFIFHPVDSDIFILLIFLSGTLPIVFILEKYILSKDHLVFSTLGILGLILIGIFILTAFILPLEIFTIIYHVIVPYGYIILIIIALLVIGVYLKLSIAGPAEVRKTSLPIAIGFTLQVVALFITSTSDLIGHGLNLGGIVLILIGIIRMR